MIPKRYIGYAGMLGAIYVASKIVEQSPQYIQINRHRLKQHLRYLGLSSKFIFNLIKLFESGILTKEILIVAFKKFRENPLYKFLPKLCVMIFAQVMVFGLALESSGNLHSTYLQIKSNTESVLNENYATDY